MIAGSFAILVDKNNRVLLQHRSNDAPTNPQKWQLWGGAVEKREDAAETVRREIKEELGVALSPSEITYFKNYQGENGETCAVSVVKTKDEWKLNLSEGDGFGLFDKEALMSLDMESITQKSPGDYFSAAV